MTTTDFISQAWTKAQGTVFTDAVNGPKWSYLLTLGNYYINQWANASSSDWSSLYNPTYPVGTITTANSYDFDPTVVREISHENGDPVRVLHTDALNYTDYTLVPADQLVRYYYKNVVARIGSTLQFPQAFTTTAAEYSGSLLMPMYGYAAKLVSPTDLIPVDDPNWLVCIVAYDAALHDILRKDIAPLIKQEADMLWEGMIVNSEAQRNTMSTSWRPFSGYLWENDYSGYDYGYNGWL